MNRRTFLAGAGSALGLPTVLAGSVLGAGSAAKSIDAVEGGSRTWMLPDPPRQGGRPLFEVLWDRSTTREFEPRMLSEAELAGLLWAAFGVNRPQSGHRTAPSAMNSQEIQIYLALTDATWRWEAATTRLHEVRRGDLRGATGGQAYVKEAPVTLIYVADYARLDRAPEADRAFYAAADVGFIGQNVHLFCASEGLATVVHVVPDPAGLARELHLGEGQQVLLAQCVGYPRSKERK